jgi:hypothetical protein
VDETTLQKVLAKWHSTEVRGLHKLNAVDPERFRALDSACFPNPCAYEVKMFTFVSRDFRLKRQLTW